MAKPIIEKGGDMMEDNFTAAESVAGDTVEKKSVNLIENAKNMISTIKGKDLETRIEEFSSEITMVIEGISDDQERLDKKNQSLKEQLDKLDERLSAMEKTVGKKAVGLTIIRQLTWLAGIVCTSVILITVIKLLA